MAIRKAAFSNVHFRGRGMVYKESGRKPVKTPLKTKENRRNALVTCAFRLFPGTNGDTELFEKSSNINGFETFGQQIFLLLTS